MVVVDHKKNINRIIDRIKDYAPLFDNGATVGKLRKVIFGDLEAEAIKSEIMLPYAFVTTRNQSQATRYPFGITNGASQNQVTADYEITIVAASKIRTEASQKLLYDLIKEMRNMIAADTTFLDPISSLDPVFQRSIVSEVPWNPETKGQLITAATLVLHATIGTAFELDIPGIGRLALLSKPGQTEGVDTDEDREADGNREVTEKGDIGAIFAEYECNETTNAALRAKFGTKENVDVYVGGVNERTLSVRYIDITHTASFDEIERCVLHLEIIQP